MFPHFLVAIADLTHPLSNNRSSVRIIGCSMGNAININAYRLQNTALLCTINHINTKEKTTNQPTSNPRRTPVSIITSFARVIKLPKLSIPEPNKIAYLCIEVQDMSVVTSLRARKTSDSLYTIVPRYTITTPLLSEALAGTGGAWRLLRCGLCFLLATRNVSDRPMHLCRRTRKRTGLSNRLTILHEPRLPCVATVVSS